MDITDMHSLPEWDDHRMLQRRYEGEEWKMAAQLEAAKKLYNKWRDIFLFVESYCETLQDSEEYDHAEKNKELIWQNLFIVAPKIIGAAGIDEYVLKMENASIIRNNCRELMEQVNFTAMVGAGEEKYAAAIELEMDVFRELFKTWVATFRKDEYEDEWGLFI
ncbi:hypothetical protein [Agriterribacter sp.]|uniref:hypothetical protein n=1 Tax=Agriterribacter sp. TaxID=2821509 RepID=UPI002BA0E958|nr:hypothetical protein [Agriterribacter sp.]HRP57336.1 hypothetical protein [Agriterribacter sp.]